MYYIYISDQTLKNILTFVALQHIIDK
jgi:hypothetical protein